MVGNAYENSSVNLNVSDRSRPTSGREYNEKTVWQYSVDSSGSGYVLKMTKVCLAGRGISSSRMTCLWGLFTALHITVLSKMELFMALLQTQQSSVALVAIEQSET